MAFTFVAPRGAPVEDISPDLLGAILQPNWAHTESPEATAARESAALN